MKWLKKKKKKEKDRIGEMIDYGIEFLNWKRTENNRTSEKNSPTGDIDDSNQNPDATVPCCIVKAITSANESSPFEKHRLT